MYKNFETQNLTFIVMYKVHVNNVLFIMRIMYVTALVTCDLCVLTLG